MLIRFSAENYKSINEKTEFSLIANKERRHPSHVVKGDSLNLLKSGLIYGANASGKSNFIKSIDFSQKVVTKGIERINPVNCHFRLNNDNILKPSIFNYEIKTNEKCYSYGFAVILNESKIVEEWLYEISKKGERLIFERFLNEEDEHDIEIGVELSHESKTKFDVYKDDFRKSNKILFLSEMNRKNLDKIHEAKPFKDVYEWFSNKLHVLFPSSRYRGLNFIGDDEEMSSTYNSFLNIFKTGINSVTTTEVDLDKFDIPQQIKDDLAKKLEKENLILFRINNITYSAERNNNNEFKVKKIGLQHIKDDKTPIVFDISDESDGTQRLFDFIPAFHDLTISDSVYVVDEIDRSLHSKLTYGLFSYFLANSKNSESQLIASTHDSLLMDFNLLRRDEIWFIEKSNNSSVMYSLDEFKIRNDKIIQKDYLLGRYGAIPLFEGFDNINIRRCQEEID